MCHPGPRGTGWGPSRGEEGPPRAGSGVAGAERGRGPATELEDGVGDVQGEVEAVLQADAVAVEGLVAVVAEPVDDALELNRVGWVGAEAPGATGSVPFPHMDDLHGAVVLHVHAQPSPAV